MSSLSPEALTLHGGCGCSSIRYTISIPPLQERIFISGYRNLRAPIISFDHSNLCRHISRAIVHCWFVCPPEWITWTIKSTPQVSTNGIDETSQLPTRDLIDRIDDFSGVITNYSSSSAVIRSFCTRCGTHFLGRENREDSAEIKTVYIVLGTLDNESLKMEGVRPDRHFQWDFGIGWVKDTLSGEDGALGGEESEGLPRHPEGRVEDVV